MRTLPRAEIVRLCELLGHDADEVASMTVTPKSVEVTYAHRVTDDDPEDIQ